MDQATYPIGTRPPWEMCTALGGERYMLCGDRVIDIGTHWKRRSDGKVYEVVWMNDWETPRVQLRLAGATNLKNTHWVNPENLVRLYDGWVWTPDQSSEQAADTSASTAIGRTAE